MNDFCVKIALSKILIFVSILSSFERLFINIIMIFNLKTIDFVCDFFSII